MAYIRKLPSGKWQATVRLEDGSRKTFTHPLRRNVVTWAQDIELNGLPVTEHTGLRFDAWQQRFAANRRVEDSTSRTENALIKLHLKPYWDERYLEEIRPSTVQEWFAWMTQKGTGRESQRKVFNYLRVCLDAAVRDELIEHNPCSSIKPPKPNPSKVDWYTRDQVWQIVGALPNNVDQTLVLLMSFCGLRWGEAAGLQVRHVDLKRKRLFVQKVATQDGRMKDYPKSSASQRELPIPQLLVGYLLEQTQGKSPLQLVCPSADGEPQQGTNWRKRWYKAIDRIREDDPGFPRYSPHALRHSGASWLVQAGVSLREVQSFLGHSSPVMTNRYAHLAPGAHEAIEAVWERTLPAPDAPVTHAGRASGN